MFPSYLNTTRAPEHLTIRSEATRDVHRSYLAADARRVRRSAGRSTSRRRPTR